MTLPLSFLVSHASLGPDGRLQVEEEPFLQA